ncbi:WIYLD domain [Sesbania bispinosa]|nr:WIYLD domain [Sesbania bispinosa]
MASNPKVNKAYDAMRALGISDEEVKPVLKKLLKAYENNWELIEEDNYRTLADAYFESMDDKQAECKRKAPISYHDGERPKQKQHLIDRDDQVSSIDNPRQVLYVKDTEIPPKTFKQEIVKPSQTSMGDMKPCSQTLQTRLSEVEQISNSPCMAARDRKSYPEIASSTSHCQDPIEEPSSPHIQRKNMSRDHQKKKLVKLRIEKPKFHLGPGSTSNGGSSDASNGKRKKEDTPPCNNNTGTSKGNIDIASSPSGEVKISLNCEAALGQPNFHIPNLDEVIKSMEEKYKTVEPQLSMVKLLDELCGSFLKMGLNLNRKGSNAKYTNSRKGKLFVGDIAKGDCLSLSFPCACSQETGGEFAYTPQGLLKEEFLTACMSMKIEPQDHHFVYCLECPLERPRDESKAEPCKGHLVRKFIKECWRKCGCDMQCGNRVVQRGLSCKLQVFLTREGKGWGVRTLEDLPKGCFVCEYIGEILTNTELYERTVHNCGNDRHTYPVTLDADWGSEGVLKDEEALCLDATYNGNVARFINHRCFDANLIDIPVEVETPDRHYYHLALFTSRKVNAYEELTWDYGIDFDDLDHPIKAFQCRCGSAFCRNKQQKGTTSLKNKKVRDTNANK